MAGEHPSEPTLLAYLEGELEPTERGAVEAHLAGCEDCATDVAAARAGREAARDAPLLELPAEARDRIRGALPQQESAARTPTRRWLAIAAPIAAALAVVAGVATLATSDDRGDGDGAAGEAAADTALEESAGEDSGGAAAPDTVGREALKLVAGNPRAIARELRRQGFDASVEDDAVVVRTEQKAELARALRDFPSGGVRIKVE